MPYRSIYPILLLFLFYSCQPEKSEKKPVSIALLNGPSAIAFACLTDSIRQISGHQIEVTVYDSPDKIQALMARQEVDIATLPMPTAANLYNKGIEYRLLGCPVWGTLFWIENRAVETDKNILHLFGQGSTPDILTRYLISTSRLKTDREIIFNYTIPTAQALAQAMLGGKIRNAILPEPFVSMLMAKDGSIQIRTDLAALSEQPDDLYAGGFPQTAILVRSNLLSDSPQLIDSLNLLFVNTSRNVIASPQSIAGRLVKQNLLPDTMLAKPVIRNCRIDYRTTPGINRDVARFLQLIYDYQPQAIGGKMPDQQFYAFPDTLRHADAR